MAIASTANLLLGLRSTDTGRQYLRSMVTHAGMDSELCEAGAQYILIPMLPFAVELCLKAIKSQGGCSFLWTHNLKSLWADLVEEERRAIRERVRDPAARLEEGLRREAFGITGAVRTVDRVIRIHQSDFERWRYVVDGEKDLTNEQEHVDIAEAIMDLYGIVAACVEYHKSRGEPQPSPLSVGAPAR